ncbi:MAG TPA: hypothetical protein VJV03_14145 [Pyrinomonadaceae bacterium]|nr:hypothetical protein [Pyrinomonadaceae bacterium]
MMITASGNLLRALTLVVLVCLVIPIAAQSPATNDEQELQQKRELTQKAYTLVDEISTAALGLKLPENRAFVLTSAADLLWGHDEKRARALFWDALNSINLLVDPVGNGTTPSVKKNAHKHYFAIYTLRQGLLRTVAKRDHQLALDMLRTTRQVPVEQVKTSYRLPDDSELEQQIVTEAAARDPQKGLQIARDSLAKGLTLQLLELLDRLNQRDQEVAAQFAVDIVNKLHTKNLPTDILASQIALNLVRWSRKPSTIEPEKDSAAHESYQLKLGDEARRELVEMLANAAITASANSTLLNSINEIMPEIQRFVPERLALLQKKLSVFEQTLNKEQRSWNDYASLLRTGSPEDMIAGSLTRDHDEQRLMLRQQAILLAVRTRRTEALGEFIRNEIVNDSLRRSLMDDIDSQQITAAAGRGDADELRTLLPRVRRTEERARAMAEIAVVLEKKGDHDEAVRLLDQARTLIKVDFESEAQSNALFALVAAYALVEPPKAFAIIERTIDRANEQINKALLLDKIARTGLVKNGELLMQTATTISPEYMLFRYGKAMTALANADFNRTRTAAHRFERMELRLMMRLLLAESLLEDGRRTK